MGLRPGHCYREITKPAYTRYAVNVQSRDYLKGAPASRVRTFIMGIPESINAYNYKVSVVSPRAMQIRHEALESARLNMNNYISKKLAKIFYFARVLVYPHHVLRENKQMTGAGADRMQKGMAKSFGKKIGRAARVQEAQEILSAWCFERDLAIITGGMERARHKLPGGFEVVVERLTPTTGRTLDELKRLIEENPDLAKIEAEVVKPVVAAAAEAPVAGEAGAVAPAGTAAEPGKEGAPAVAAAPAAGKEGKPAGKEAKPAGKEEKREKKR
ncbi:MAG TPA: 50S ribosomal protein L16 [archaeon]|nr:50S ribosomal protein L16 [archaeon]